MCHQPLKWWPGDSCPSLDVWPCAGCCVQRSSPPLLVGYQQVAWMRFTELRSRDVSPLVMPMACGSISLPRRSGGGPDDQHLPTQQHSSHHWHLSESHMDVGGVANPAPGGRNSPESGGRFCSAMNQLIASRGGSNLWWGSWIRAHFTTLAACLG